MSGILARGRTPWRSRIEHHELNTSDVDGAKTFYGALFGWTFQDMQMPEGVYSIVSTAEGAPFGGFSCNPVPGAPSHWLNYIIVASLDAAVADVGARGGAVVAGRTEVPGFGWFAVCQAPRGAAFAIWESAEAPPPPEPQAKKARARKRR